MLIYLKISVQNLTQKTKQIFPCSPPYLLMYGWINNFWKRCFLWLVLQSLKIAVFYYCFVIGNFFNFFPSKVLISLKDWTFKTMALSIDILFLVLCYLRKKLSWYRSTIISATLNDPSVCARGGAKLCWMVGAPEKKLIIFGVCISTSGRWPCLLQCYILFVVFVLLLVVKCLQC